ncbi:MAG: hypothetical protein ISS16_05900 [Ignavibacteria bacterium]|nr:hypothetical protein [Ignavibacteria bacterium]
MNLEELNIMPNDMIEGFRDLKNKINSENYDFEEVDKFKKDINTVADILNKKYISDDEYADVVWRVDELVEVVGI